MTPYRTPPPAIFCIELIRECPRCGRDASFSCSERARYGGLRYSETTQCGHCGLLQTGDGVVAPRDVRSKILSRDGAWEARLEDCGTDRGTVAKLLRETLKLSVQDAVRAMKDPGHSLASGTRAEVEGLAALFHEAGARVVVVAADASRVEKAYVAAVIAGDFARAESRYDEIARKPRRSTLGARDAGLTYESKADGLDSVLTWIGAEGAKGPWSIVKDESARLFGFDEHVVTSPRITTEERALVEQYIE